MKQPPIAALAVAAQTRKTVYPAPFDAQVEGRIKRRLGDHFGLKNFGVNLTQLQPGTVSALMHSHSRQDEFARLGDDEFPMGPGDCIGFPAGSGLAHVSSPEGQLVAVHKDGSPYA